jgi:hypothetical protein
MLAALPRARELLGDTGYDADWFRQALAERGISNMTARLSPASFAPSLVRIRRPNVASDPISPSMDTKWESRTLPVPPNARN